MRVETPAQTQLPFVKGSDTSEAAAKSMILPAGSQRKRVYLWAVTQHRGFIDEEGCNALQMNPSSFRPRRGELVEAGMLKDTGRRRKTSSGRQAVVWGPC